MRSGSSASDCSRCRCFPASASYALSEALNWKEGLNLKLKKAHGFYGIITIATIIGLVINFIGINPIKALVFTAVFNGVAAVPLIFIIAKVAEREGILWAMHKSGALLAHFRVGHIYYFDGRRGRWRCSSRWPRG